MSLFKKKPRPRDVYAMNIHDFTLREFGERLVEIAEFAQSRPVTLVVTPSGKVEVEIYE